MLRTAGSRFTNAGPLFEAAPLRSDGFVVVEVPLRVTGGMSELALDAASVAGLALTEVLFDAPILTSGIPCVSVSWVSDIADSVRISSWQWPTESSSA